LSYIYKKQVQLRKGIRGRGR